MFRAILFLAVLAASQAYAQGTHQMAGQNHGSVDGPTEGGQSAFAAIQEILGILENDPATDWTKVNLEALRQHLIDMDNVTLRADVKALPTGHGTQFTVSGEGTIKNAIQRMVMAHAATMNGVENWAFAATETESGAILEVSVPSEDITKVQAIGFIGVMARGMHHQAHHLMIAQGGLTAHK